MDRESPSTARLAPATASARFRRPWSSATSAVALLAALAAPVVAVGGGSGCSSTQSSGTVTTDVSSIIFVKRVTTIATANPPVIDVAGGNGQVIDYTRYEPGGS